MGQVATTESSRWSLDTTPTTTVPTITKRLAGLIILSPYLLPRSSSSRKVLRSPILAY
jgi:hypothetical protein